MSDAGTLLIDAGNSRIKWAWLTAAGLSVMGSAAHGQSGATTAAWTARSKPQRVLVCNVAGGEFAAALSAQLASLWELCPEFITSQAAAYGVSNAYIHAEKLGADRWACLLAVHHNYPGNACIVDCGTAITVDTVTAAGKHLGGLILPGLDLMQRALNTGTQGARSHAIDLDFTLQLTPLTQDTAHAVASGALYAAVAAIDRILTDLSRLLPLETCVITGGDAARILSLLTRTCRHQPDLVLQGLTIIARYNL